MNRMWTSTVFGIATAVVGGAAFVAAQSTARPGDMTRARVWVENRAPGEAVPVSIEQINGTANVHLGSIDPQLVLPIRTLSQRWQYRLVAVETGTLEQAGNDGWEAVGVVPSSSGMPRVLLKRPR